MAAFGVSTGRAHPGTTGWAVPARGADAFPGTFDERTVMEPYPASSEPEYTTPTKGLAPPSVKTAVKLIWASVALGVISSIVTFFFLDDIVESAGTSGMDQDALRTGAIIGAIVGLIISVGLAALFAYFISKGANWARIVYTVILVLGIMFNIFGLFGAQPVILLVITVVSIALSVAVLFFLYRPDANSYFKGGQASRP